ncbi:MexH family multidrug efflux RND transporter periplasmic adaptor subunit [Kushneria pakistanensis]|uniref:MexH family multidrug efflux RND transporter periplasmic adaptor subunit n=1 Tax=Kushneria pakistanensis TaxID=1508770 RepID=A0ABQ3FFA6_9GAMM|nr:efflux RND transporter periplasmic adaptor subunit [Kushneria pakistanensis]GHC21674.1 MexH family multidrug efflux RND transporter periplasmic adaptor subunit [Kushneria pakistanensis]
MPAESHDARRPLIWLVALLAVALALAFWWWLAREQAPKESGPAAPVAVGRAEVIERNLSATLHAVGDVEALDSIEIASLVTERITGLHFDSGERVSKGDLLIQLDDRAEQQGLRAASVIVEQEQREYDRLQPLARQGSIATQQVDAQRNRLESARIELARLNAALEDRTIVAPVTGFMGFNNLSTGEQISADTPLVTLDSIDQVQVDFSLPERELRRVSEGMTVTARSVAWPDRTFHGEVTTIDPRLDRGTRTVMVRAQFDNPDMALRPGMLLEITLLLPAQRRLIVPESALLGERDRQWTWVIASENGSHRAHRVNIGVLERGPGWAAIEAEDDDAALRPGASVAVSGLRDIGEGRDLVLDEDAARDTQALFKPAANGDDAPVRETSVP